jgi:uroporphyrin-III C-methyltransferase/precorrin-2 dehydrogenase/sirohydrochlorin ferrochelatase
MGTPAGADAIYPLSLKLAGRRVVVVGGGSVAFRRVAGLRAAGADILVVSPQLSPTLGDLADRGVIAARRRGYQPGDLDGAWLVLACTDQPSVNAAVAADAERQRIWCVRADDAAASAAWVPAVGRSGAVTVAVNAGRDPRRAAALRDRWVATVAAEFRSADKEEGLAGAGEAGRGRVWVVGGGPGDPGLITVTGLRLLREADVVVADRLAPLELLEELSPGADVIDAAKVPGGPAMRQDHINHALVEHARAGRAVVRLKGGDPFVFGRGREEVEACLTAGVPVTVVPGVTSAIAVPAAAGIPVTHRGLSQGFCVLAGHVSPDDPRSSVDWAALARGGMTLVLLMAIDHLAAITGALLAAGLGAGTPCAAVSDGWTRRQRVVTSPLRDLAAAVTEAGIANPAVVVIGDVAGLARASPGPPGDFGPEDPVPGAPAAQSAAGPDPAGPDHAGPDHAGPARPAGPAATGSTAATASPAATANWVPAPVHPAGAATTASPAAPPSRPRRVLVLGGARSGKSATAEGMLAGQPCVEYVATGAPPGEGDDEWDARVREHRGRRPAHWRTVETLAVADVLAAGALPPFPPPRPAVPAPALRAHPRSACPTPALRAHPLSAPAPAPPVLVDCLTTWLARVMDDCGAWDGASADRAAAGRAVAGHIDRLLDAWQRTQRHVVAVSSEVGSGVVPETAAGRRFRDELGRLNARVAAASDEVWLCTAGIARRLR